MAAGVLFALAAGLLWGLVFIVPLLLPGVSPALLSAGRYLAFGLIALPLAWLDRDRLAELSRADWIEALRLALIGNLIYYLLLSAAIQQAGAPLPTMIIGSLPVVIAIVANLRADGRPGAPRAERLPWRALAPSLLLITAGVLLVHHAEFVSGPVAGSASSAQAQAQAGAAAWGALLALGAVACWTWYPLRNAEWLRAHPQRRPSTWATAQGLATLPLAVLALLGVMGVEAWRGPPLAGAGLADVVGAEPVRFFLLMLATGLLASWLGTVCWNEASQRLPSSLAGQLIVFETLAALAYAYALRGAWPAPAAALGVAALVAGVVLGLQRGQAAGLKAGPAAASDAR
jgi:drug/metabolite transporter (DMT)-like permease